MLPHWEGNEKEYWEAGVKKYLLTITYTREFASSRTHVLLRNSWMEAAQSQIGYTLKREKNNET